MTETVYRLGTQPWVRWTRPQPGGSVAVEMPLTVPLEVARTHAAAAFTRFEERQHGP